MRNDHLDTLDPATKEFLDDVLPRMVAADTTLHDGDPGARKAMWSQDEATTLFGAAFTVRGWTEIEQVFGVLGQRFSRCDSFTIEVLAAGAMCDLGYVVAIERTTASVDGRPPAGYALRVTTVFRRDEGEWRVVHRHGDPFDNAAATVAGELREPSVDGG